MIAASKWRAGLATLLLVSTVAVIALIHRRAKVQDTGCSVDRGEIPERALPGRDQGEWTKQRNLCIQLGQERVRRMSMTRAAREKLALISYEQVQDCERMIALPYHPHPSWFRSDVPVQVEVARASQP